MNRVERELYKHDNWKAGGRSLRLPEGDGFYRQNLEKLETLRRSDGDRAFSLYRMGELDRLFFRGRRNVAGIAEYQV